jgi:hypothetical protein
MSGIQWLGRQAWAERRRDPNSFDHIEVSNRLADCATQAEINDTMAAIGPSFPRSARIRRADDGRYLAACVCIAIILLSASAHASAIRAFGEVEPGGVAKPLPLM